MMREFTERAIVNDLAVCVLANHRGFHTVVQDLAPYAAKRLERRLMAGKYGLHRLAMGQQLAAIGAGNGMVLVEPLALQPLPDHARGSRADLVLKLKLKLDALRFQEAVIEARIDIEFSEALADVIRPGLTTVREQLVAVPVARLETKAFRGHFAHLVR